MNDKRIKHIGLLFLSAFLLSSCAKEEPTGRGITTDDEILFLTSMPYVETRAYDNTTTAGNLENEGFYVTALNLDSLDSKGNPLEKFSEQLVTKVEGVGFRSRMCRWPEKNGGKDGNLRFFAFYPSREIMRDIAGVDVSNNQYFGLKYSTTKTDTAVLYEYWMTKFKVNEDIRKQSDFVTAKVEGSKTKNLYSGIKLKFQHQLSRVSLEAFGNSDSYDVEIAGVRIGGIALECDFSFEGKPVNYKEKSGNATTIGRWIGAGQKKGCVEYIFTEGDVVIPIDKEHHSKKSEATSIMGNGGSAMVIPYDYTIWKGKYSTKDNKNNEYIYFSVLLRVKESASGKNSLLYPYIEGVNINSSVTTDNMNVVYLSVEKSTGKVKKRLYRNKDNKKFYTDTDYKEEYATPDTEEIRNYGWAAAIPYIGQSTVEKMRWNPGYQYIFQLNYSTGIGIQDPADAFPGKPIIYPVEVTGTEKVWHTVDTLVSDEIKLNVQQ